MAGGAGAVLSGSLADTLPESDEGDGYSYLPWVDCICAGVPCQDVSVAGKRAGLKGERTGLFYDFARILRELRPTWFVFENVPGLLSSNRGRDFAEVLRVLMVECRYGIQWRVLDSQFFGVAQRRKRLFIVGRFGKPCPPEVLFEPTSSKGNIAKGGEAGQTVAFALAARAGGTGSDSSGLGNAWNTTYVANDLISIQDVRGHRDKKQNGIGIDASGGPMYTLDGTSQHAVGFAENQLCSPSDANRVRDFAGLPEGMDSPRYRALGNAVTVQVAEWIGRQIVRAEELGDVLSK